VGWRQFGGGGHSRYNAGISNKKWASPMEGVLSEAW
jgi:hypothetical protein